MCFKLKIEDGIYKIYGIDKLYSIIEDPRLRELGDDISTQDVDDYINEYTNELININNMIVEPNDPEPIEASSYSSYNSTTYALTYAITPNSSYADFTNSGGDCTNFISQCLYAGGKSMHYGTAYAGDCWYYTTGTNRSSTWTGANQFRTYIFSGNSHLNMSSSTWGSVVSGDIIQLINGNNQAYHSMIITGVQYGASGRQDLLVCAHTSNRKHVSLNFYYSGQTKAYYHVN